jgi:hypothetical protein
MRGNNIVQNLLFYRKRKQYLIYLLVREGGLRLCSRGFNRRINTEREKYCLYLLVREGGLRLCSRGFNRRINSAWERGDYQHLKDFQYF